MTTYALKHFSSDFVILIEMDNRFTKVKSQKNAYVVDKNMYLPTKIDYS